MRAKVTYRRGREIAREPHPSQQGAWIGEYAKPEDAELENDSLRDIVQTQRAISQWDGDEPSRQDVRATLRALSRAADDDARAAVRAIDGWTESLLVTAALQIFRKVHPQPAPVPDAVLRPEGWTPAQLRTAASLALRELDAESPVGGRPRMQARHVEFARTLRSYWLRTHAHASFSREFETPFARFAGDMFRRIGQDVSKRTLHRILTAAKRAG